MPDYDHFLSDQELSSINSAHSILQGEDAEWLKRGAILFQKNAVQVGENIKRDLKNAVSMRTGDSERLFLQEGSVIS